MYHGGIIRKTPDQIEEMAAAGSIQKRCLNLLAAKVRPGVTTRELDEAAERFIRSQGAEPSFKGYRGFPGSICASPNDMVVHGIPGAYELQRGDLLSIDVGVTYEGWVADAAITVPIGEVPDESRRLLRTTKEALFDAVVEPSRRSPRETLIGAADRYYDAIEQGDGHLVPVIDEYHALLTSNAIFIKRTANIGILPPEMALDYGCTGPVLRGSGIDYDLRRDGEERYTEMYDGYAFEVICQRNGHYPKDHDYPPVPKEAALGDCWHRFYVRMLEVVQSVDLVRQAIERYSAARGPWGEPIKLTQKLPKGEAYLETESPRGQMGFYIVSDGTGRPYKCRVRPPCFATGADAGFSARRQAS